MYTIIAITIAVFVCFLFVSIIGAIAGAKGVDPITGRKLRD